MRRPSRDATMAGMPPTILIVDDHAGFRRAARDALRADGFEVVGEARDGASAIAETVRLVPAIVLLDIQLPDIDGFAVAARLGSVQEPPMVILISGRDARDYGGRVEAAPALGFIPKSGLTGAAIRALVG
jgi:DNA-binding NarL/FixJ family response regulator